MKKLLSWLLCLVMVCTLCVPAFAAEKTTYPTFDSMFTAGDSVCRGYGLDGYFSTTTSEYIHGIDGSYSDLVADTLGIDMAQRTMMAYPAFRARDVLYFLGGDIERDDLFDLYYTYDRRQIEAIQDSGGDRNDVASRGDYFIDRLAESGKTLVMLDGGPADVFFASISDLTVMDLSTITSNPSAVVEKMIQSLWNHYEEFLINYKSLVQRIREINPDTTIVLLGTFNPLKDVAITDDGLLHVGDALATVTALLNQNIKNIALQNNCLYVDISNAETYTLEESLSLTGLLSGGVDFEHLYHPSPDGQAYISRQILTALEQEKKASTNISVDLGKVKSVCAVTVDGKPVLGYKYDANTHRLTVPCLFTTAKLLTVTEVRSNGSVYVAAYQLQWTHHNGYQGYLLYANKDVVKSCSNLIQTTLSLIKTGLGTIKK